MGRIHVITDDAEHEAFRAQARREGRSLSEWLREAGRQRLREGQPTSLGKPGALDAFFDEIDRRHGAASPPEDDWPAHKHRIAAARSSRPPDDA